MGLFNPLLGEYKEVHCPNGNIVFILKDPNKAFLVRGNEYKIILNATVNSLNEIKLHLGIEHNDEIDKLISEIDDKSKDLEINYAACYREFFSSPCDSYALERLRNCDNSVRDSTNLLRTINVITETCLELSKQGKNCDLNYIISQISQILEKLDKSI